MAAIDFSQLKKLPPEMRIKALDKLEEELNKLINEKQKEIESNQKEIQEAQDLLEDARHELRVLEDIETPKIMPVDVGKLFAREETKEEKEKLALERIAEGAPAGRLPAEQENYARFMAERMSMDQIYDRLKNIQEEQKKTGIETFYHQHFATAAERAIDFKKQAEEQGVYNPPEKSEMLMTQSEKLIKYLKGEQ